MLHRFLRGQTDTCETPEKENGPTDSAGKPEENRESLLPKSKLSNFVQDLRSIANSSSLWVLSDVWCWWPDHKHSVALLSPHQAPHSLSPRGGKCHKPLHWGTGKIKWDWWRIFCGTKISAVNWFILSVIIFWVKRHLKEQDLETGLPSPMPGTVRGSIPNGASAFAPHPPRLLLEYPLSHKTAVKSVITHQLVAGDGRYAHPLWQEHVFWKFLTDIDQ